MAKVVDLFCGIGGLTSGLRTAGLNVVAGVDIDSKCQYAFEANNNALFISKSIKDVTGDEINELYDDDPVRILVGCAPCQPFSNHQKNKYDRKMHKDWGLLNDFLRIVADTMPMIVSMENVPTLLKESIFDDFVEGLRNLGYSVKYEVHNTFDYGMAQRRYRLLLLASLLGDIDFVDDKEEGRTVRDVIGHLPPVSMGIPDQNDRYHVSSLLSDVNLRRIQSSLPGGTWEDWDPNLLPDCYKKESGKTYKSVYGRMDYDSIAPTLTTQFHSYGTGRFGHPEQNRAITVREGAILQSFPENYVFLPPHEKVQVSVLSRQIGNAVPPRLGLHIGRSIIRHLNDNGVNYND